VPSAPLSKRSRTAAVSSTSKPRTPFEVCAQTSTISPSRKRMMSMS